MAERVAAIAKKPKTKQKCSNICNHKLGFNSSGCPAEILLDLQRTAGNQAVQKLIKSGALQKKHKVDQLDDICRQEIVLEYRLGMVISKLKTKKQLQEKQGIEEEKSDVNKGKTTISKPELEIEAKKLVEKVTPEAKPTQVSKEKPAISRPELEIEAKKPIEKVTPEAKPTKETPGEASVLPGVSDKTLPSTAMPPSVSRTAVVPKAAPKEKVGVEIESPEESKEPEEANGLEKVAVKASPVSPKDDPAFQAVVELTKKTASKEKAHASAKVKSAEAQAAVVSPSNEVESKAAAGQVQEMDQVTPKPFDRAAFKAALIKKIESITPKNLEEADKLKESGKVKSIKGDLTTQVSQSKEQSQGEIKEKVEQAPDKSGIKSKQVTPLPPAEAGPSPKGINASQAAPKPRSESDVSLQEGSKKLDQKMADANITEKMLEKSNESGFISAVNAKKASQANSVEAPKVYRKEEQSTLSKSQSEMTMAAKTQIGAMHSSRQKQLAQVVVQQVNSKGKDEKEREKVANHIQEIYNGTKEKVETILSKLDRGVDDIFEKGSTEAQKAFEDYVSNRMKIYKDERYDRIGGSILWAKDKLLGLPDEVNVFYEEGRNLYIKMMDGLLDRIAEAVETGLTAAKNEISRGKKEIHTYINSLPESLKSVGQEAAKDIQSKFDNLEQSVDEKQNQLVDSLAQKYVEKVQQLDTRIQEMKAENQGLVDAAIGALTGVIKTILSLKEMLLNVLSRVKEAVGLIISDPIGFLGNLVAGVKLGFQNFVSKIDKYLLEGLIGWLFGALAEAGIQMPESFDLKGILSLVLQILGLTYQNIRARAVKIVGEKAISIIERTAGILYNIITKGPAAIWEEIKEKLGDFKSMVLEPIKDFLITKVITAGVTWILGLLNPVSAFIKAAKAIYDIIMFFVERASQVMTLINAIVDSVVSIAKGNITMAATKVEQSLAKAIPVVIGLLAGLLGLGGISEKIKSIIKKIQSPIEKAIDWVIEKAVKPLVMKGMAFLEKGKEKLIGAGKAALQVGLPQDPNERVKLAAQAAVSAAKKLTGRVTQSLLNPILAGIKVRYGLTAIQPYKKGGTWWAKATINPTVDQDLGVPSAEADKGSVEVREIASRELEHELRSVPSREEAQRIVGQVAKRLRPQGLKNLEIGPESPKGVLTIYAEASNKEPLGHLIAEALERKEEHQEVPRNVAVRTAVELKLAPESDSESGKETKPEETHTAEYIEATHTGVRTKGGIKLGSSISTELRFVTWNIKALTSKNARDHAEDQFVENLKTQKNIMARIEEIRIQNFNLSPCDDCCGLLRMLLDDIRSAQKGNPKLKSAEIYWQELYKQRSEKKPGHHSATQTTWEGIRRLTEGRGWTIHATSDALPKKTGIEEGKEKEALGEVSKRFVWEGRGTKQHITGVKPEQEFTAP